MRQQVDKIFFPLNCLKSFILIGAILTILVGITASFIIIYAFLMSSFWIVFSRELRTVLIVSFLVICNLIILSGLSGLYGVLRRKNIFLNIYSISIFVYIILFIIIGVFSIIYPKHLLYSCDSPNGKMLQDTIDAANSTLCKYQCQCYFNNYGDYTHQQIDNLNKLYLLNSSSTNDTLPVNATTCSSWEDDDYPYSYQLFLMQSFFNCSGWCPGDSSDNLIFFFTNINNGVPVDYCYNSLSQLFGKFGLALILSSFMVSIILFVVLITLICLCFHPKRRAGGKSFQMNINLLFDQSFTSQENDNDIQKG